MSNVPAEPERHEFELDCNNAPGIKVFLLAGDLRSPLAGNKHLKLEPWLQQVAARGHRGLIGVGGVWSNFILSLALAAANARVNSVGIIRGDEHQSRHASSQATAMLQDAASLGMQLHFVSRAAYRQRSEADWQARWLDQYPDYLFVPEGGSDIEAAVACARLLPRSLTQRLDATHWVVAAGTGATAAGVAAAMPATHKLIVINISGDPQVQAIVRGWSSRLLSDRKRIALALAAGQTGSLERQLVFPVSSNQTRFGKLSPELCELANICFAQTGVLLDPVYTVKAMQQVQSMQQRGEFDADARIAFIHTGGLQGWRGYLDGFSQYLSPEVLEYINTLDHTA